MSQTSSEFRWSFQRLGGLDQVVLETGEAIRRIGELDPKLWVALSCPIRGLDFDERTLALIDTDRDGRIRRPELVAAVEWACARLKDPCSLIPGRERLPLADIAEDSDESRRLRATCRAILDKLGSQAEDIGLEEVRQALSHANDQLFNGDGILPSMEGLDAPIRAFVEDALRVMGGVEDASGRPGINQAIAEAFVRSLADWRTWQHSVEQVPKPLGDATGQAWSLMQELKPKLDDYYLRCELAAYAPQAVGALNVDDHFAAANAAGLLEQPALKELPLSRAEPDKALDLTTGLNPAWRDDVEQLAGLLAPLLPDKAKLSRKDWLDIQTRFEPYAASLAGKPDPEPAPVTIAPVDGFDVLGASRIDEILDSDVASKFRDLAARDLKVPVSAADITAAEKLVLFNQHLYRLMINFVSFAEFYGLKNHAAFESGTLYIDGRSCRLCVLAGSPDTHAVLAALSHLYLLYCTCTRKDKISGKQLDGLNIVAAVTAGDSDLLLENRNGVFVDNQGQDWDATVIKIIDNPIGLRQAIWSPYKRFGAMISEQIGKIASSKENALTNAAGQQLQQLTTQPAEAPAPAKFDIGRNAGIFAAIGLALGAIGTALASIARALFALQWWQLPLVFLGLFVLISGPSVVMAWLKLRQRTLGPLLEASGWAVNGRVFIKYSVASTLTGEADLPLNAARNFEDPLRSGKNKGLIVFIVAVLLGAAAVGAWLWFHPISLPWT